MSLFGKVLAVLNLLGAIGLVYLASVNYGVRQQWAYVVLRYDLMIDGLPVDPTDLDRQGLPLVERLGDDTIKDLFSNVGGNPVRTQVEEVQAVQAKVNGLVQKHDNDKRQQAFALAGILLPLSDSLLERDEYLATQAHLATDAGLKALEARYAAALRDAKKEGASADRTYAQAFRLGVHAQGGAPSEAITGLIVDKLPADPKAEVNVQQLLTDALEAQRQGMVKRLERHVTDALTNAEQSKSAAPGQPQNSRESQREAIARLLFGLAPALASDAIEAGEHPEKGKFAGLKPGTAAWVRALAGTEELKRRQRRVFVVGGVKTALNAIAARSATVRLLASQVDAAAGEERRLFLSDDTALLDEAREQAARLRDEAALIRENVKKVASQQQTVKSRAKDVEAAEAALKESVGYTEKAIEKLRAETEKARAERVKARDLLGTLSDREKVIQDLERQVREAQAKKR